MAMIFEQASTVGHIAASVPEAPAVFQKLGIDFRCGRNQAFSEALAKKNISFEAFTGHVQAERQARQGRGEDIRSVDVLSMSPAVLAAYIEDTHHDYLKQRLPQIAKLLLAVLCAHGDKREELFTVYRLFGALKADLEQHLIKEENILFPALIEGAQNPRTAVIKEQVIAEHEAAGQLLCMLRRAAEDFVPPPSACASYRRAYELLPEMEADLYRHIHLENNILLKNSTIGGIDDARERD